MVPWGYSVISSSWGGCQYLGLFCLPLTFLEWMGLILYYLFIFTFSSSAAGFCVNVCLRSKEALQGLRWMSCFVFLWDSHKTRNEEFSLKSSLYLFLECWSPKWTWSSLLGDVNFLGLGFPQITLNSESTISCTSSFSFSLMSSAPRMETHFPAPPWATDSGSLVFYPLLIP